MEIQWFPPGILNLESPQQIKMRYDRTGEKSKEIYILGETDVDQVLAAAQNDDFKITAHIIARHFYHLF